MAAWVVRQGPRELVDQIETFDMDFPAWAYELEREGRRHMVTVVVAGGRMHSLQLADASRHAIATRGRTAVDRVLDRDEPPRFILVTSAGLQELVDEPQNGDRPSGSPNGL
jgi:hypothetical protein